jgi:hypothetical protein
MHNPAMHGTNIKICYSVGIYRQTQLVQYSGVFIVYLATCFGHLFGHLQAVLEGMYFPC